MPDTNINTSLQISRSRQSEEETLHNGRSNVKDEEHDTSPIRRGAVRALIQDFGPLWFTWCMNAGILAILTHQSPYQFAGLKTVSDIFFVLDLIFFVTFSFLFTARFIWFGRQAYNEIASNVVDLTLVACWSISWLTLTAMVCLTVSNATWGGHRFTLLGYSMWWIGAVWNLIVLFWVFFTLITQQSNSKSKSKSSSSSSSNRIPTTIIIPAVSVSTVAATGGLVTTQAYSLSPRLAVPVILVSFLYVGIGIFLGLILTTYLFHSLLTQGWPAGPQIATLFILIGPFGQSSAALQLLGNAAHVKGQFAAYDRGNFLTADSAPALETACILLSLLMTGLSVVWTFLAILALVQRAFRRELSWAPNWNSLIFPTGTLATSTLEFGIAMDSPAFRVVTAIMIVALVAVFLLNLAFTVVRIKQGKLLVVREDPRVEERRKAR